MGISSSLLRPEELFEFKKLNPDTLLDDVQIPERAENRAPTNRKWLIVFIVAWLIVMPFLIYTLYYSDVRRLVGTYDSCGDICGVKNHKYDDFPCTGKDLTEKKYLEFDYGSPSNLAEIQFKSRKCVEECSNGYKPEFGICFRDFNDEFQTKDFQMASAHIGNFFNEVAWQLFFCSIIALALSVGMLMLFRFATAVVVWGILVGSLLLSGILVIVLWLYYNASRFDRLEDKRSFLYVNITITVIFVVLMFVLIFARKKIRLVIALFDEATKAIFSMPALITIPLLTAIVEGIILVLFFTVTVYMVSSGILTKVDNSFNIYIRNGVMVFTMIFNSIMTLWLLEFVTGIQYMVVAGAVGKWYFTKTKEYLDSPILKSVAIAFKFHLGTVALGSLIITIVTIIRKLLESLAKNEKTKIIIQCCLKPLEDFVKFLSKNAYIVSALHGQPFLKSGKRAAKLLVQNIGDVIAINSIGDFVLGMAQLLVVVLSTLICLGMLSGSVPGDTPERDLGISMACILIAIVATIIVVIFFSVFETTIDTIFICYCEDALLNDGISRPYFMSRNMMEFMENSKKIYCKEAK